MRPRLLIVTAAFGEGHNSAARNLGIALEARGAEVRICDPCMLAAPHLTSFLSGVYRYLTNRLPRVWEMIYRSTDQRDFNRKRVPMMRKPERLLARLLDDFRPDAVVSTYPIYPYFLKRAFAESGRPVPTFTVVTDSLELNAAWLRAPSDYWLVTDVHTRERMLRIGIAPERVVATGFPVHPSFATLRPVPASDSCRPFRVLFFPTANRQSLLELASAMLAVSPEVRLTLALGRNFRRHHRVAREIRETFPDRVRMIGWTRHVPKLLSSHHVVVGKAGGATVHEAIAACCPMLIHHLVPGQEEGNLELLETIGGGTIAQDAEALRGGISDMLADQASRWRRMKDALARHGHNDGAVAAARFILNSIAKP